MMKPRDTIASLQEATEAVYMMQAPPVVGVLASISLETFSWVRVNWVFYRVVSSAAAVNRWSLLRVNTGAAQEGLNLQGSFNIPNLADVPFTWAKGLGCEMNTTENVCSPAPDAWVKDPTTLQYGVANIDAADQIGEGRICIQVVRR